MNDKDILSTDAISALMYVNHITLHQMAKKLGVNSSRLHAMFKFKDEEHNKLLRIACTYVLEKMRDKNEERADYILPNEYLEVVCRE